MNFAVEMMNFASKPRNFVSKMRSFVLKTRNFVFKMMNLAGVLPRTRGSQDCCGSQRAGKLCIQNDDFSLKMMNFAFKMMILGRPGGTGQDLGRPQRLGPSASTGSG